MMLSQNRRSRGAADDNDDGAFHESNKNAMNVSSSNLRRRSNATKAKNGEYRLSAPERNNDGESDVNGIERKVHGFPDSLTPFVHIPDTEHFDASLDAYMPSSRSVSPEPNRKESDVEAQQHRNRTISYDRENTFHASFLTQESVTDFNTDFNNSSQDALSLSNDFDQREFNNRTSDKFSDEQVGKRLKDPPSGVNENLKPFRQEFSAYDNENNDELSFRSNNESRKTGTDSGSSSGITPAVDPNSFYGKFQQSRRIVGRLVNNEYVQLAIIFLIVLNGILLGFDTTDMVQNDKNAQYIVDTIDLVFLSIFTLEIAMQIYYYAFSLFRDAWLVFDLVVVVISWAGLFQELVLCDGIDDGVANAACDSLSNFQVLRAFRIFRTFRLVTRVRPLRDLVLALGEVLPRMSAIVLLLTVVFYVFAVLFTEQFSRYEDAEIQMYFGTLQDSFLTCFEMMTMEWANVWFAVKKSDPYGWWSIVTFVMIAGFIVFNLIVAVVVEAVSATEETVRRLDGIESNSPASKLAEAQERVDLLQSHLFEMMEQQEQIQYMLESMAGELLQLETERMKAKYREVRLREEINRRIEYQKQIEDKSSEEKQPNEAIKKVSMQFLQKIEFKKAERKKQVEAEAMQSSSDQESIMDKSTRKKKRRNSLRSGFSRDGSGKSIGTQHSGDSAKSAPDSINSPNGRSTQSIRKKVDSSQKEESTGRTDSGTVSERKKKAVGNWKKLLAVQKEFDI